jgi:hypothetical protein
MCRWRRCRDVWCWLPPQLLPQVCYDNDNLHNTYLYAYIHTYLHAYLHTYLHAYIHTYLYAYIHANAHSYADEFDPTTFRVDQEGLYSGLERQGAERVYSHEGRQHPCKVRQHLRRVGILCTLRFFASLYSIHLTVSCR